MSKNIYSIHKRTPDKETLQKFKEEFYIDQYGDLRNKIDRGPGHGKDQLAGRIDKKYIVVSVNNKIWYIHCIIDYLYHGNWYHDIIDHKNRNTYDNNINNLERSNYKENNKNKSLSMNNTSSILGITHRNKQNYIICSCYKNGKNNAIRFYYKNESRKLLHKNVYYWSSFESALEAAQLYNWLIRKQKGYPVEHLPEIKVDLNRKTSDLINWNSKDSNDIPGLHHEKDHWQFSFTCWLDGKEVERLSFPYKDQNRKRPRKDRYYWNSKNEAFQIAKICGYILRKKHNLPI